jgi:hypothetical protein
VDTDGGRVDHYQLFLDPSLFNPMHQVYSSGAKFLYMIFMVIGSYSTAAIDWVVNPDKLMKPLSDFYQNVLSRVYQVAPPQILVGATFAALVVSIFFRQSPGGENKTRLTKAHWDRLSAGFAVMLFVLALAANPFRIVRGVLSTIATFSGYMTGTDGSTLDKTMAGNNVNLLLKPMSQLLTYHDTLPAECSSKWSYGVNVDMPPRCLTASQKAATDPDELSILLSIMAVAVAVCFGYFAIVGLSRLLRHLFLAVFYSIGLMYVGVVSLAQRRPFDPLAKSLARAGAHFLFAIALVVVMAVVPTVVLASVHGTSWLPLWLQFVALGAAYVVAAKIIVEMTKDSAPLAKILEGHARNSVWFNVLYPKDPALAKESAVGTMLAPGTKWATAQYVDKKGKLASRYAAGKQRVTSWWNGPDDAAADDGGATSVVQDSVNGAGSVARATKDTPQHIAATESVTMPSEPAQVLPAVATYFAPSGHFRRSSDEADETGATSGEQPPLDVEIMYEETGRPYEDMTSVAAMGPGGSVEALSLTAGSGSSGLWQSEDTHQSVVPYSRGGIPYQVILDQEQLNEAVRNLSQAASGTVGGTVTDSDQVPEMHRSWSALSDWNRLTKTWTDSLAHGRRVMSAAQDIRAVSPIDASTDGLVSFAGMHSGIGGVRANWVSRHRYDDLASYQAVKPDTKREESFSNLQVPALISNVLRPSEVLVEGEHASRMYTASTGRNCLMDERLLAPVFVCAAPGAEGAGEVSISTRTGFGDTV